ncbi:MAG TPA: P1 family peptidase [Saprospiraceae bacterium]|nr:P1 family peptidase [Saprospiraceae bacterium]
MKFLIGLSLLFAFTPSINSQEMLHKKRAHEIGLKVGILTPGPYNAITDVKGVSVGHTTLIEGDSIRTGVTVILPHNGNIFQEKLPAAVYVGNGFGKMIGTTQIMELGNIESPIALTNTLNAPKVADALISYTLSQSSNENVRSVNVVVGETNDGYLNDIRGRHVLEEHVISAIKKASSSSVEEGNVGAGTGTICMGFKGGIGTSSRVLPKSKGGYTVGVLVQTNFGGILSIDGVPVGKEFKNHYMMDEVPYTVDGSCMIIIATDAPLSDRNLERLAKRSFLAFGKVGSFSSNGSGDYSLAFSTHKDSRIKNDTQSKPELSNEQMSPLFLAVLEATEEAIYNSLLTAQDLTGYKNRTVKALPIQELTDLLIRYQRIK